MGPLGRVGEDGVDVAEVAKGRAVAAVVRGQVRDEVRAVLVGGQQLGLEAGVAQIRGEELDRRRARCPAG